MKTDDLVAALSTRIEPVNRRLVSWTMGIALLAAAVVALGLMLAGLGIRADLMTARALTFLVLKLAFAVSVVGVSSTYLMRLARPGGERRTSSIRIMMPFAAIVVLAAVSLGLAPTSHWDKMVMGISGLNACSPFRLSRSCLSPSLSLRCEKRLRPIWSGRGLSPVSSQAA